MRSWVSALLTLVSHTIARRSGLGYGSGRSTTRSRTVKMAVVAPTPSASASTAAIVNPGVRRSRRQPKRRSWKNVSMPGLDGQDDRVVDALHAELGGIPLEAELARR